MTDNNLPIPFWTEPTDVISGPDTGRTIQAIGQLFAWPAMQSLVRLNPNARSDRSYFATESSIFRAMQTDSAEKWEKRVNEFEARFPDWMISFGHDCWVITGILWELDELRLLWDQQLVTSDAVREIFAGMCMKWTASHSELTLEDGNRFDYWDLEMASLIHCWVAIKSFDPWVNATLVELLTEQG